MSSCKAFCTQQGRGSLDSGPTHLCNLPAKWQGLVQIQMPRTGPLSGFLMCLSGFVDSLMVAQ